MELKTKLNLDDIVVSPNLTSELKEEDLRTIGSAVHDEWLIDKTSRSEWEDRTADAMKLALQVMEEKTFPWENASNVKFPLITIAALQYSARAYPALIPSPDIVKCKTYGEESNSENQQRADRIADYMNYQLLEEDECWEENMDKTFISQAIIGCAFKKSYFDPSLQHNVSEQVLAKDLYIPYFAKSLEKASRITQVIYVSKNDLIEKNRLGLFEKYKFDSQPVVDKSSPLFAAQEESQGVEALPNDPSASIELLEQHRFLDLDGDGYQEPYIVTISKETQQVLRIVSRFSTKDIKKNRKGEITCIYPTNYFTKFPFIPSPDGGIYDLGFGALLGPLNESINTTLNQLIDAGTLAVTAGGFLGRGVKFRSGDNSFKPFEWKRVDSSGDDIHKGVFPLPVREPSNVLFQLLSLLIDYGERIGMATDPMVGMNPGQNTPAETSRNMITEGSRVFSAIYKRTYRSLKEEFRKLYKLNAVFMNETQSYSSQTSAYTQAIRSDFIGNVNNIFPAADPSMVSDEQKLQQVMALKAAATNSPQLYNAIEVEKRYLKALKLSNADISVVLNTNPPPPPPDPKVIIEGMKQEFSKMKWKGEVQLKIMDMQQELQYLRAEIMEKESRVALNMAQAQGVETGHQVAAMQTAVSMMKQRHDNLIQMIETLRGFAELDLKKEENDLKRMAGMETKSTND